MKWDWDRLVLCLFYMSTFFPVIDPKDNIKPLIPLHSVARGPKLCLYFSEQPLCAINSEKRVEKHEGLDVVASLKL